MRRALLLLMMAAGIALIVWAGWQNQRQRRSATQAQQERRVDLIPNNAGSAASYAYTDQSPLRGKQAPAFTLLDLNGRKVSLSDFKGRPLVVNFWGTYCAPCKIEMPWLEEFSRKYAADGFQVVGVTYDSEVGRDTIDRDAQQLGVTYPILLSTPKAEKDYLSGTDALPMSFYVDRTGKVIEVTAGLGSKEQLESMVKETIAAGGR
ncbi:MAG: TlpA disulfide reductase family protein [Acidobacteriaceae bacterium]|jgi:thiol-disulfide isomerase/thioredoxin